MIPKPKKELDNNVKIMSKTAFTLIELMVVITLIGILVIGVSKIDLSKGQDIQKSLSFANKIQIPIETTISNSLIGKGFGNPLIIANNFRIEIGTGISSKGGFGAILTYYNTGTTSITGTLVDKFEAEKLYEISDIKCYNLDNSISTPISGTGYIYLTGSQVSTNCGGGKIMEINTKYKKQYPHNIRLNPVSGVVEKN